MRKPDDGEFERLVQPIEDRMIRTVWRILRNPDDASEAFQDALAKVWQRFRRVRRHPNPHALILRICVNAAYDSLRRRIRGEQRVDGQANPDSLPASDPPAWKALSMEERRTEVLSAVGRLPRRQAEAILMRLAQEQSYADIALALGCSEPTVRTHVARGRARLSEMLAHLAPSASMEARPDEEQSP